MAAKRMEAIVAISGVLDKSMSRAVETAQKKISGISPKALKVATAVGGVSAAAFSAGKKLAGVGGEYQRAMNQMRASTGATEAEMKELGGVVQQVYKNNFGESMQDVSDNVAEISRSTDLSGEALQKVTEGAITLRDTFDYDVTESARAAKAMMINFGVGGEKALSMIAAGAQNGLDFSGELLDSISEYSVQFSKVGMSADDMFNILQQGADSGAWTIDKVGDAIKEFSIRAIDSSDSTIGAYGKLGLNADKMMQIFAKGGPQANESFSMVLNKLMAVDDAVERDSIGVALFGTMWEDLGVEAMQALADTENKAYGTGKELQNMQKYKYNDLQTALEGIGRVVEVAVLPIASKLAQKLTEMQPQIEKAVNVAMKKIQEIAPVAKAVFGFLKDHIHGVIITAILLTSTIGMLKFAKLAADIGKCVKAIKNMQIITKISAIATKVAAGAQKVWNAVVTVGKGVAKGFGIAMKLMNGKFLLIVAVIAAVVAAGIWMYKHWGWLKNKAVSIAKKIKDVFVGMKDKIVGAFGTLADKIGGAFSKIAGVVKSPINAVISLVNKAIDGINKIAIDIPEWVPVVGGARFEMGIPKIPLLETGGMTDGISIAGEGRYNEMVITPDPRYRSENIGYWQQAGRMLGIDDPDYTLGGNSSNRVVTFGDVIFSPKIEINGDAKRADILEALREAKDEFLDDLEEWWEERKEFVYE